MLREESCEAGEKVVKRAVEPASGNLFVQRCPEPQMRI